MTHPLIDAGRSTMGWSDSPQTIGHREDSPSPIDSTPLTLMLILLASAATLAALKQAGFRFVIGVGK